MRDFGWASAINRRSVLSGAALAGAASAVPFEAPAKAARSPTCLVGRTISVVRTGADMQVQTEAGVVAGYNRDGVYTFKGIPYGADTGGSNRFRAPQRPEPWLGVRSTRAYGGVSPQDIGGPPENDEDHFTLQWDKGYPSENCLSLNIWTPELKTGRKRPVMVWLHGGGFVVGSGHELPFYDGENLSRKGDVVVVTINHRLGAVGFLDLSEIDPSFAESANVGMLDIIAALEWVRTTIGEFGGDAQNVTIFGQSGGGGKVCALLAMPRARGLFHKAIVQSGSMARAKEQGEARRLAKAMMDRLNAKDVAALQAISWQELLARSREAYDAIHGAEGFLASAGAFAPVVDGVLLPQHPFDPKAPPTSEHIPLLVGSVANEMPLAFFNPDAPAMTEEQLVASAVKAFGEEPGRAIVAAYRRWKPDVPPFELQTLIIDPRTAVVRHADRQSANRADVYTFLFQRKATVLDGKLLAHHNAELPYVFDNIDRGLGITGGGEKAYILADRMSKAWAAFAHTGNPNHPGLPSWPKYDAKSGPVMVFDDRCEVLLDPDREGRLLIENSGKALEVW